MDRDRRDDGGLAPDDGSDRGAVLRTNSSILRAARCARISQRIGRRRPGIEGRVCEPGHHYEWAFLLDRWAGLTGRSRPAAVSRLIAFADTHGVDARRGVAIKAVLGDGSVHDPVARLWAQAERVRAYSVGQWPGDADGIAAAVQGLRRFLTTTTAGVWYDQLGADDRFIIEPARATSLYHIIGAVTELAKQKRPLSTTART